MSNLVEQVTQLVQQIQYNLPLNLKFLAIFWVVHVCNFFVGYRLCIFGIYPRHPMGLLGIFFSPFLHGDFNHVFFNSIPLFVLSSLLLLNGPLLFLDVTIFIIILGGLLTWIFGRSALHVGASGLIMGYFSFSLVYAYHVPSLQAILLGFISVYYFGGLLFELIPAERNVSWEGHVFGFVAGIVCYYSLPWLLVVMPDYTRLLVV